MKKVILKKFSIVFITLCSVFFSVTFFISGTGESFAEEYQQVSGLMDLRTTFSDGDYDIEQLVLLAKQRGFSILFINDHDRVAMEYGLPPFRNIIKKKVELNSINIQGADTFIHSIKEASKKHPDMIIIPGSETTPFYYWTGNPIQGNMTAHEHEKRLLTVGMENPDDYENLPILHNNLSTRYANKAIPEIVFFFVSLAAAIFMLRWKGYLRITGIVVMLLSLGFIINSTPFRSSPFDPYHGDQGMAPYQLVVDYVNSRGGMTFWNYPETKSGVRKLGPIQVSTLPYPNALSESKNYTGFASLYGDTITLTEPGNIWDMTLKEYCMGYRSKPPWGIATSDYHGENESGNRLGNFQTVFLVREKTKDAVLAALRNGKMYACQVSWPHVLNLNEFSVSPADSELRGISGDQIVLRGFPRIRISLSSPGTDAQKAKVRLIRSGNLISVFEDKLPLEIDYIDPYYRPGETIYYRMDMRGSGIIVSNPIFVKFE